MMSHPTFRILSAPVRRLVRGRAATALIVATLGLALGANTAVLSIADALLFRSVPFPDPPRLVVISSSFPRMRQVTTGLSGPEAIEFAGLTRSFAASGPFAFVGATVQTPGEALRVQGVQLADGAAAALGAGAILGRTFEGRDFTTGSARAVLLGEAFWRRAFGSDAGIVGRLVTIDGLSREIAGVLGASSLLNRPVDVWFPLPLDQVRGGGRADHRYTVVARLDGGGLAAARADVERAVAVWKAETGEFHAPAPGFHPVAVTPFAEATTGLTRRPVAALVCAVAFVLLIACANVSNLLLARAERRRREIAVQVALGATRARLAMEQAAEGLLLAGAGSVAGLAVAAGLIRFIRATWPVAGDTAFGGLDARVLAVNVAAALVTGAAIAVVPLMRLRAGRAAEWLQGSPRGATGGGRSRLQNTLVTAQLALAVALSAAAGLAVRTLLALNAVDPGFQAAGVIRALVSLPEQSYQADPQVWSFYDRLQSEVRKIPGVSSAAVMSGLPPLRRSNDSTFLLDGAEVLDHDAMHQVDFVQHVTPDYLDVLRIPLLEGRRLTTHDDERAAPVVVVNETLARRFWPGQSAVGRRMRAAGTGARWFTVVGVVGDVKQGGLHAAVGSEAHVPFRQSRMLLPGWLPTSMNLVVRTGPADPAALAGSLRSTVRAIDPAVALSGIAPMQDVIDRTIAQPRLLAWLLAGFAVLAVVVASVGVYAVTSYAIASRRAEFGVRMALGATRRDIFRHVLGGATATVAAGILLGGGGFLLGARLLANLLFGIAPTDPASLAAGVVVIAGSGLLAALAPSLQASRVDPLVALRAP